MSDDVSGLRAARAIGDLAELADKYRLLVALRLGQAGRTESRRDAMRAIAVRFPGALREWDEATLPELQRRHAEVLSLRARIAREGEPALLLYEVGEHAWLRLSIRVHRALCEALHAKRLLAGRPLTPELAARVAEKLGLDAARLQAIAAPPAGRVSELIHREVARAEGLSVAALKAALFPAGAPAPITQGARPW